MKDRQNKMMHALLNFKLCRSFFLGPAFSFSEHGILQRCIASWMDPIRQINLKIQYEGDN